MKKVVRIICIVLCVRFDFRVGIYCLTKNEKISGRDRIFGIKGIYR